MKNVKIYREAQALLNSYQLTILILRIIKMVPLFQLLKIVALGIQKVKAQIKTQ